jgi:ribonuclease HII
MKFRYDDDDDAIECGVDEAGRGCLAGPVVAAAVIWDPAINTGLALEIKDSKKVSKKKRERLAEYIKENAIAYGVGTASHEEIDDINILNATYVAMHRAIDQINRPIDRLLIDGTGFKTYENKYRESGDEDAEILVQHHNIVDGDAKYVAIAAASILAKTTHDTIVCQYVESHEECQKYGWEKNMCYGTKVHLDAIRDHGLTAYHRKTFRKKK